MLKMRPYAKISFNAMKRKMLILPGDRVGIRFGSTDSPYEGIRVQPDIHSSNLPEPFRTRYQDPLSDVDGVRLPCNDVMIADSMTCSNTIFYCSRACDTVKFAVQGSGEIFSFNDIKCSDFMPDFDWEQEAALL